MKLTHEMQRFFKENGYLFLERHLSASQTMILQKEVPSLLVEGGEGRVLEKDGHTVRSVYGCHTTNAVFGQLVRSPNLLRPAQQLIDQLLYVYQFKINVKAAFGGDIWPWHQDFIFWFNEDGMPRPLATSVVIFLDDVTEFNGPLYLVPGSHKEGILNTTNTTPKFLADGQVQKPNWMSDVNADLQYALSRDTMASVISKYGVVAPKGPAGSVLFFHPNLVHGSSNNMSPFDRKLALITYNSTSNLPTFAAGRRPEFMVSSDCQALKELQE